MAIAFPLDTFLIKTEGSFSEASKTSVLKVINVEQTINVNTNRNFCIKDAYDYVKNIIGKENSDLMVYEHPSSIIKGEDLYF